MAPRQSESALQRFGDPPPMGNICRDLPWDYPGLNGTEITVLAPDRVIVPEKRCGFIATPQINVPGSLPDNIDKVRIDDDSIFGDQRQVHQLRRPDNGPVKRVSMEGQAMGFSNDVQIESGQINAAASHEGGSPMLK